MFKGCFASKNNAFRLRIQNIVLFQQRPAVPFPVRGAKYIYYSLYVEI
jgi:hypothetical protein